MRTVFLLFVLTLSTAVLKAVEVLDEQCIIELSPTQYQGVQGLWGNLPRSVVSAKPELFRAIVPMAKTFEWLEPDLPFAGSKALAALEGIGAQRLAVITPIIPGGCNTERLDPGRGKIIQYAQPNGMVYGSEADLDPETKQRLRQINFLPLLPLSPVRGKPGRAAVVIIDSGINYAGFKPQPGEEHSTSFVGGNPFVDPAGHGTAVAEVIREFTASTPIISFQVLSTFSLNDGQRVTAGSEAMVLRALLRLHQLNFERLAVNLSLQMWGTSTLWRRVFASLEDKALFVAAAGNLNQQVEVGTPYVPASASDMKDVLTLGGINGQDKKASFSCYGGAVTLGAPVVVKVPSGTFAGTSFSAPQGVGTAIFLWEQKNDQPDLPTPSQTKQAIVQGARFAGGLLNLFGAPKVLDVVGALAALDNPERKADANPIRITAVEGTWSKTYKLAFNDLVSIYGSGFVDKEYKNDIDMAPVQVLVNGYPIKLLAATPTRLEAVLPSAFQGQVWNPDKSLLSVVKLDYTGTAIADSAVSALEFTPVPASPGLGLMARVLYPVAEPDKPGQKPALSVVSETNPVRPGDTVILYISGVQCLAIADETVTVLLGETSKDVPLLATEVTGVFAARIQIPNVPGAAFGLTGHIIARDAYVAFGVNYVPH